MTAAALGSNLCECTNRLVVISALSCQRWEGNNPSFLVRCLSYGYCLFNHWSSECLHATAVWVHFVECNFPWETEIADWVYSSTVRLYSSWLLCNQCCSPFRLSSYLMTLLLTCWSTKLFHVQEKLQLSFAFFRIACQESCWSWFDSEALHQN